MDMKKASQQTGLVIFSDWKVILAEKYAELKKIVPSGKVNLIPF